MYRSIIFREFIKIYSIEGEYVRSFKYDINEFGNYLFHSNFFSFEIKPLYKWIRL